MDAPLPLALTMGDPAGCGPAITVGAWTALARGGGPPFYVRAPAALFDPAPVREIATPCEASQVFPEALPVLAIDAPCPAIDPGTPDPASSAAILASIEAAVGDVRNGLAGAIVTNPVSKHLLASSGFSHPGHTEYLAELAGGPGEPPPNPVMMLVGGGLRVALATIHMPLREAVDAIDRPGLVRLATIVSRALSSDFGIAAPRLAFTGVNPHAGEAGLLGREEIDTINPAAGDLRLRGIDISDARPADTVFAEALDGRYDAVIAMTHDQGLIPVKTLDFWGGVNTTLGLPFIRTSPDHGTAYDAARAGTTRPDSLIAAIHLASMMVESRAREAKRS